MKKAVILSAGLGTRLRPLTDKTPKPMAPIGGAPLLEHIIRLLTKSGLTDIRVNLHHLPWVVTDHFGDGRDFGARIEYSLEAELLGAAGALNNFRHALTEPFLVYYGDVLTTMDLPAFINAHQASGAVATVALYRVPNPTECGLVDTDAAGRILRFVEKPPVAFTDLANAGIYACQPEILDFIPPSGHSDFGRDVFPAMLAAGARLQGHEVSEYLIDIGSKTKYEQANRDYESRAREGGAPGVRRGDTE